MEGTIDEEVIVDSGDHASLPADAIAFLKRVKVSIPTFYRLVESCKQAIMADGIDVVKVGLKTVKDIEEPGLEYLKIIYVLHLPFEKILEYQTQFYQSTLESMVTEAMHESWAHAGTRLARFMKHFNISFDDSLS